jgi:hypothetical protein
VGGTIAVVEGGDEAGQNLLGAELLGEVVDLIPEFAVQCTESEEGGGRQARVSGQLVSDPSGATVAAVPPLRRVVARMERWAVWYPKKVSFSWESLRAMFSRNWRASTSGLEKYLHVAASWAGSGLPLGVDTRLRYCGASDYAVKATRSEYDGACLDHQSESKH